MNSDNAMCTSEMYTDVYQEICTSMFRRSIIPNASKLGHTQMSTERKENAVIVVYSFNGMLCNNEN